MTKFEEKICYFKSEQREILRLHEELEKRKKSYKDQILESFGLREGEAMNVIEIMESFSKIMDLKQEEA